ncbi:hypothetical protein P7C73_g1876, partial [Tremellales sp. Uapishka_1]
MPRAPKSSPTKVKGKPEPYSRSSPQHTPPLDGASGSTSIPSTPKKTYDKSLMVRYVLESCANINWEAVAELTGKDATSALTPRREQGYLAKDDPAAVDLQPAVVYLWTRMELNHEDPDGHKDPRGGVPCCQRLKDRSDQREKQSAKPDWQAATTVHFPGKTKSQLGDVWRKVVLPRLKKGETIE